MVGGLPYKNAEGLEFADGEGGVQVMHVRGSMRGLGLGIGLG